MEAELLLWIHGHASPALDAAFVFSWVFGPRRFCVPLVLLAAAWHLGRRQTREALAWVDGANDAVVSVASNPASLERHPAAGRGALRRVDSDLGPLVVREYRKREFYVDVLYGGAELDAALAALDAANPLTERQPAEDPNRSLG